MCGPLGPAVCNETPRMENKLIRVLMVEDNALEAHLIRRALAALNGSQTRATSFEVVPVGTVQAGIDRLAQGDIDLVLLDLSLPDSHGLDTALRVRSSVPDIPIVVLTSTDDEATALEALHAGVQDYLIKGTVNGQSLVRSIIYAIERTRSEKEWRKVASVLTATLEATADGILVVDVCGKIVSFNQKFCDIWGIPESGLRSPDHDQALGYVLDQLTDRQGFIAKVQALYVRPEEESFDVIEFKDGRVFERYSKPQRIGDNVVGRVWSFRDVTDRKRAEHDLKKALEWQEALFEGSRDAVFLSDADSRFVVVNRGACELTGYSKVELLGMRIPDLHEDVDLDAYRTYHARIMGGEEIMTEAPVLRKNQTKLYAEFNNRRVVISGVAYMHTTARDISERKRAEQALRQSQEKYRAILESIADGYYEVDLAGNFTFFNESLCRILGYPADEMMGMNNRQYMDQETAHKVYRTFNGVYTTGSQLKGFGYEISRKDGTKKFIECSISLITDSDGSRTGFRGIIRDETERRQTEEALSRLAAIVECSDDAILSSDLVGNIISWNVGAERLFGYSDAEVLGRPLSILATPDHLSEFFDIGEKVRDGEIVRHLETVRVRKDGTNIDVSLTVSPIRDSSGRITGSSGIARDITERKRAEEELKEFASKLERSNRELEEFAYIASHDLQEPLRKIIAFGDRLKVKLASSLGEEGMDYLDRMQSAARRMQTLINDLLAFSRVTTKGRPFVPVRLSEVAKNVVSDLEVTTERTDGRVEIDALPDIEADASQMHQLFQNLIANALKFHRSDHPPVVRVTGGLLTPRDGIQDQVCQIVVEDNGIGFDEKYLDRIFTVFQRLHGRSEFEGTGIGLAICRKIAERHGGHITAKSAPGAGASFIVTLPVKQPKGDHG